MSTTSSRASASLQGLASAGRVPPRWGARLPDAATQRKMPRGPSCSSRLMPAEPARVRAIAASARPCSSRPGSPAIVPARPRSARFSASWSGRRDERRASSAVMMTSPTSGAWLAGRRAWPLMARRPPRRAAGRFPASAGRGTAGGRVPGLRRSARGAWRMAACPRVWRSRSFLGVPARGGRLQVDSGMQAVRERALPRRGSLPRLPGAARTAPGASRDGSGRRSRRRRGAAGRVAGQGP